MIACLLLALLAAAPLAALPPAAGDLAWVAPAEPRQGHLVHLVFVVDALEDPDTSTGPVVEVDPQAREIRIDLANGCTFASCDVVAPRLIEVDEVYVHAVGTWTVRVSDGGTALRSFTFEVQDWPQPTPAERIPTGQHAPAEGFWFAPAFPGTGFYLEQRSGSLALAVLDFAGGLPEWRLDVAPLRADTAAWVFPDYVDGACIGCSPAASPTVVPTQEPLRLRFTSARTAVAELGDGTQRELVHLAWGDAYLAAPAAAADVPLPDLEGHWVLETMAPDPGELHPAALYLCPAQPIDGGVEFLDEDKQWTLQCLAATAQQPARCELRDYALVQPPVALAAIADIEADRMQLVRATGSLSGAPFRAFRVGSYRAYFSPMPPDFCNRSFD